jgi:tetratricopeptide (TPR) repeat protein
MQLLRCIAYSFILLITVTSNPSVTASTTAQSNTNLPSVYLSFYTDPYLTTYANNFVARLDEQLVQNGVNLITYTNNQMTPDEAAQIDLSLYLQSPQLEPGGEVIADSRPRKPNLSVISPIVYNTFEALQWKVRYEQTDKTATQVILDLVTALSMYSIKQCDSANQYFLRAEKALPTLASDTTNILASIAFYRGTCALIARDFETAAHFYELSRSSIPKLTLFTDASAVNLAWTYIQLGRSDDAMGLMNNEVERFDPKYSFGFATTALKQRSQLHVLTFQYDQAIADLDLAIQYCLASTNVTPSFCASFYTLRGQTYLLLYQWDNVLADYSKALELDPTYADAYFYRGVLKYSILQTGASLYPEALADFQQYLDLAPHGEHAADATRDATDIQTQLAALNN